MLIRIPVSLIAIRNALHHRDYPLFHSLLVTIWLTGSRASASGAGVFNIRHRTTVAICR